MSSAHGVDVYVLLSDAAAAAQRKILRKQMIFRQGDPANSVFYLQKGKVKLTVTSEQGKEAIISLIGEQEFFGEQCMAGLQTRPSSAVALTDTVLLQMDKGRLRHAIQRHPAISEVFMNHLLSRVVRSEEDLIDQMFNCSERRLARALLLLAKPAGDEKSNTAIPHISQETLAEMVGTTRSRVSFFMNKFRRLGLIDYRSGLEVRSALGRTVLQLPTRRELAAERE